MEAAQLGNTGRPRQPSQELRPRPSSTAATTGQAVYEQLAEQADRRMRQASASSRPALRDDSATLSRSGPAQHSIGAPAADEPPSAAAAAVPRAVAAPATAARASSPPVHVPGPAKAARRSRDPRQEGFGAAGHGAHRDASAPADAHAAGVRGGDRTTAGSDLGSAVGDWQQDSSTPQVRGAARGRSAAAECAAGSGRKIGGRSTERRRAPQP